MTSRSAGPPPPTSTKGLRPKGIKPSAHRSEPMATRRPSAGEAFVDPDQAALDLRVETAKPPPPNLISLMVSALLALGLALSPYCVLPLPDMAGALMASAGLQDLLGWPVPTTGYGLTLWTPFLPIAIFIGGWLGWGLGGAVVGTFLLAGFAGLPLFADGGGWHYGMRPGAGYLIGSLVGSLCAGILFASRSQAREGKVLMAVRVGIATVLAVLAAHLCGLMGLTLQFLAGWLSFEALGQWAIHLSGMPLIGHLVLTAALLACIRPLRMIFWLVLY